MSKYDSLSDGDLLKLLDEEFWDEGFDVGDVPDICLKAAQVIRRQVGEVASWMISRGLATGHGDSITDMLNEADWQIEERIRRARSDY